MAKRGEGQKGQRKRGDKKVKERKGQGGGEEKDEREGGFSYEIINLAPLLAISPKIPLHLAFQSPNLELF